MFDLIVGDWGEDAGAEERVAVAIAYRVFDTGPSMMVVDAKTRPGFGPSLVGASLDRDEVIGTWLADTVFAISDAVLALDGRVAELQMRSSSC